MTLSRRLGIKIAGICVLMALPVAIGTASLYLSGIIAAIVYPLLFMLGLSLVPVGVLLLGGAMPDMMGRLLFAMGQLSAGDGWLVQHDGEWRMHPGRSVDGEAQVYLAGDWHPVADTTHQTRLAWQPFGILWHKTNEQLAHARAGADTATDGGQPERDGINAHEPAGVDGWTVAMHRYLTDGLRQLGDISILTQIEEVTERKASRSDGSTAKGALIGSIVGLVLGIMTGYVAVFGV